MTTSAPIRAAGGVLWRHGPDGTEIALVHRQRYDDWSLPKGKLLTSEHPLIGACREVLEETGFRPIAGRRLRSQSYDIGNHLKVVDFWAMRATSGAFAPSKEVDDIVWLSPGEAAHRVSYTRDVAVIEALLDRPPEDTVITLVRHAEAGHKGQWPHADDLRPLNVVGKAQAGELAKALVWFRPIQVITAAPLRCVQTVEPLAASLGLPVLIKADFNVNNYAESPEVAMAYINEMAKNQISGVISSQGEVIPNLVAKFVRKSSITFNHAHDPPRSQKGSAWVMHFHHGRLTGADYYATFDGKRPVASGVTL